VKEPGTNIVDLVNFLIRASKENNHPKGIHRFIEICKKLNIPSTLVRKSLRKELTDTHHESPLAQKLDIDLKSPTNLKEKLSKWVSKEQQSDDDDLEGETEEFEDADF